MDIFMEKIVAKKKTIADHMITVGVVLAGIILIMLSLTIEVIQKLNIGIILIVGIAYLGYRLITSRNLEYEYIVTNGDLDIDKIINKRNRKRIFSANCKEFDIVAPVKNDSYNRSLHGIKKRIDASGSLDSPDAWFVTLNYKGEKTLVIFEPDERMLENFRKYIPRKVLK